MSEPERYALHRWLLNSTSSLEIDRQDYENLRAASEGLAEILSAEQKYDALMENYAELEKSLIEEALNHMIFSHTVIDESSSPGEIISRRVLNLFASARLYLDALPRHVATILSADQATAERLKKMPAELYDSSLAYRVMEAVRNYAQHRELPVHGFQWHSEWEEIQSESARLVFSVAPKLNVNSLRADAKFKRSVLAELDILGPDVLLMPLTREYIEKLSSLHEQFRLAVAAEETRWEDACRSALARFQEAFPDEEITLAASKAVDDRQRAEPIDIPAPPDPYRQRLRRKNRHAINLRRRYVRS
jgi:hypothetical protein